MDMSERERKRQLKKKKRRIRRIKLYIRRTIFALVCIALLAGIGYSFKHFLIDGLIRGEVPQQGAAERTESVYEDSTSDVGEAAAKDGASEEGKHAEGDASDTGEEVKKDNASEEGENPSEAEASDNSEDAAEEASLRDELIHSGIIYDGIYLDEVDVSGLDYDGAVKAYEDYLKDMEKLKVTFKDNLGSYSTTLSDIDLKVDYISGVCDVLTFGRTGSILTRYKEIEMLKSDHITLTPKKTIDEEKLTELLTNNTDDMKKEAVSSSMTRNDGNFVVYPSEKGLDLDYEKTIKLVDNILEKTWQQKDITIAAVTREVEPGYTEEDFYGVDSLLGRSVTKYNQRNKERIGNLIAGTSKLADNVVLPGQQFSVYDTVAPFTEENGYLNAGQYINAELVDGLGGGICQVATTLYDAVLEAELQVDERYPHSMTVSYVDKGMDAAIAEGYEDFKFTNNTEYPIYIDAYAGGGTISVAIYGHETRPSSRRITFESQVIETTKPGEERTIYDDTLPKGTTNVTDAHTGYYVEVWKHIYEDGELVDSVKINGSQYSAIPKTTRIGTMTQ